VSEEALGWFLVATLYRRFTSMVLPCEHLLGGGVGILGTRRGSNNHLHHNYDRVHRINVSTPFFDSQKSEEGSGAPATSAKNKSRFHSQLTNQPGMGASKHIIKESIVESSIEDEATFISSNFFSAGQILFSSVYPRAQLTSFIICFALYLTP
jgi:hypothetical protein